MEWIIGIAYLSVFAIVIGGIASTMGVGDDE